MPGKRVIRTRYGRNITVREENACAALARLADGDALYRIHECVFGVLALESEPMDPRL